jgi:hypothetical protein
MEYIIAALALLVIYRMRRSLWGYIQPHVAEYAWFATLFFIIWAYCTFQPVRNLVNYLLRLLLG